ncbi:hypothetical protein V7056_03225 [Bacillus sp. JJ664]
MKKVWLVQMVLIVLLFGCKPLQNDLLDTSQLEKVEPTGNLTEEQLKTIPVTYNATSLEEGLDALPFKVKIPKDFPFDAVPLKISSIEDFRQDRKNVRVSFMTTAKDRTEEIILLLGVDNFQAEQSGTTEDVHLEKDVVAKFTGNTLFFEKDGMNYTVSYINKNISSEQHKKDIIKIANQML